MEPPKQVDYDPLCPYCDHTFSHVNVHVHEGHFVFGMQVAVSVGVFSCPHCKRALGVAARDHAGLAPSE